MMAEGALTASSLASASPEMQKTGFFNLMQIGKLPDGRTIQTRITGDQDPGYGSTSKMLSEAAICLAKDDLATGGGVWTPAAAMGPLAARAPPRSSSSVSSSSGRGDSTGTASSPPESLAADDDDRRLCLTPALRGREFFGMPPEGAAEWLTGWNAERDGGAAAGGAAVAAASVALAASPILAGEEARRGTNGRSAVQCRA